MKTTCEFCGSYIKDTEECCPSCGASNPQHKRFTDDSPKTIEELKQWYKDRNLPDENITRFFIGKDIKEPMAFGIYEKSPGYFVVYKNKTSGERAVRYEGTDEAYAVNELLLRLKSEILNQKANQTLHTTSSRNVNSQSEEFYPLNFVPIFLYIFGFVFAINTQDRFHLGLSVVSALIISFVSVFIVSFIGKITRKKTGEWRIPGAVKIFNQRINTVLLVMGLTFLIAIPVVRAFTAPKYYQYEDNIICSQYSSFYLYDEDARDYDEIADYDLPEEFINNKDAYAWDRHMPWVSNDSDYSDFVPFEDSRYSDNRYGSSSGGSSSSGSDSSYDWDSGSSWDSGSTDWDSDW